MRRAEEVAERGRMSATRDQGQKFKFIYANLYQIYRNEKP
jgi:hypothetical protein